MIGDIIKHEQERITYIYKISSIDMAFLKTCFKGLGPSIPIIFFSILKNLCCFSLSQTVVTQKCILIFKKIIKSMSTKKWWKV